MGHFLGSFRPTFPLFSLGSALPLLFQRSTIQAALHNVCNAHLLYAPIKSNLLLNTADLRNGLTFSVIVSCLF